MLFQVNDNRASVINRIFDFVAEALTYGASVFGITYNEINILFYYLFIPLSWAVMLDFYIRKPIASLVVVGVWGVIILCKWRNFSDWCDWLFQQSVDFLMYFNRLGSFYYLTSVIICVLVPLVIYGVLIYLLIAKR